jgi:hypothetical protein
MKNSTLLLFGGAIVLYLLWKSSPTVQANALATAQQNAALTNAAINANLTGQEVQAATGLTNSLLQAFSS